MKYMYSEHFKWNWCNISTLLLPANKVRRLCFYTCVSVHRGESIWAGTPPRPGTPLGPGTPPGTRYPLGSGTPPRTRYTLWDQVHSPWDQVHPPVAVHAGRYGQQAGGTHPTGMHSCFVIFSEELQLKNY